MEMNRVLKPGGMLIIGDPYIPAFVRPLMNVLTKLSNEGDYHFYGMKEMKKHFLMQLNCMIKPVRLYVS